MAAYATLISAMHIIEQIQNHPRPPISLDKEQLQSLTDKVTFLQNFLQSYSNINCDDDADGLESRIADAAYEAEDVIESHIVDTIHAASTTSWKKFSFVNLFPGLSKAMSSREEKMRSLYDDLQKVIQNFGLVMRDVMKIKEKTEEEDDPMPIAATAAYPSSMGHNATVGLDYVLIEVMDKLTGQQSSRQVIPIVGMGGIGKTTLARNIYVNTLIVQYFDFRGWVTISQEFNSKEILLQILVCLNNNIGSPENFFQMSEHELGEKLYKSLFGRRYLIVMDDVWSIEAWEKVSTFFPENNNGSRILVTTRLSSLAFQLTGTSDSLEMSFLDADKSWNLFCKNVFGVESCPCEFGGIGKKIVENCKGLPLSIVVVGGLLAKSKRTQEYWFYVAENLNSIVNLEDDERCSRILRLSYDQLPVHLKPCFLYMGMYPEDRQIRVPKLMKLWVAEGFLKPISGKCLEEVAREYLDDLFDRNLVLVSERGCSGRIKYCKIHDLLLDLCVREAKKLKFLCVTRQHDLNIPRDINTQRRIVVHQGTEHEVVGALTSASLIRSLTLNYSGSSFPTSFNNRLLRVLNGGNIRSNYSLKSTRGIVNCRYLDRLLILAKSTPRLPSSICLIWNLQTLIVENVGAEIGTSEIWKMPQLRHVQFYGGINLLDPPPSGERDDFVLGNLQTLSNVRNLIFGEEVIKRIPKIKKLGIYYYAEIGVRPDYCLNNLVLVHELESLSCRSFDTKVWENLALPRSLKKLSLWFTKLHWGDMATKVGSLPHLQVLKLKRHSFIGAEWETVEGQFQSLKYLIIEHCGDLEYWRTESSHFPFLEHLHLSYLTKLKEIPLEIGDIPTLKSIEVNYCSDSVVMSAKEIVKEQEDLGNFEGLQVRVALNKENQVAAESLASRNFQVEML